MFKWFWAIVALGELGLPRVLWAFIKGLLWLAFILFCGALVLRLLAQQLIL